jgi:murein L,D-transpeptidase YafK
VAGPTFPNRRTFAALVLLLAAGTGRTDEIGPAPSSCPGTGDAVAVVTRKRELWLCRDGAPTARFQVALGQGGLDKRKKGDRRTPIGTYTLGTPRPSGRYGVFIPIVYPTREQAAQGLTGGDVGIHGPPRGQAEPDATTAFDWTLGCVATGTDAEIEVVASFVRERNPVLVVR